MPDSIRLMNCWSRDGLRVKLKHLFMEERSMHAPVPLRRAYGAS